VHWPEHLGREHNVLAPGVLLDRAADDLLRAACAVDVGGVPEADAELGRLPEDRFGGFIVQRLVHPLTVSRSSCQRYSAVIGGSLGWRQVK
jgi:hypothetical protein